eukprot:COSAG02_NODE_1063_length_14846_cov_134.162745_9_plen_119_part_00
MQKFVEMSPASSETRSSCPTTSAESLVRRPFQDGIFFTRSPPESASRNGTRRIFSMCRKTSIWDLPSNRFVLKITRFQSRLFVLTIFERYALFFLAETAPPRPLGPKGEVYVPSAGKI